LIIEQAIRRPFASCGGFSLVEILVVIGIIGLLAAIAIPTFSGVSQGSAESIALRNVNLMNGAVVAYNNASEEITLPSQADTSDEEQIVALLQQSDPDDLVGSPYLPGNIAFATNASAERHRAMWNGRFFQLVKKGTAGAGIDLDALGGSLGPGP
jgi:prepilin-type N-terminal cleavage/methylation domain-containing protein